MNVDQILKKKELIVSLVIIGGGLIIASHTFQEQKKKISAIKDEVSQEEKRIALGKELSILNEKVVRAGGNYLKKTASLGADKFKELAQAANVRVISLNSVSRNDVTSYVVESYSLNLEADYHSLGRFMSSLESQPDIVKIENLTIENPQARLLGKGQGRKNNLNITLQVSVGFIKSE